MRQLFAHPVRLLTIGTLGALALMVLMLAGRPEAPPEAHAATVGSIVIAEGTSSDGTITITGYTTAVATPDQAGCDDTFIEVNAFPDMGAFDFSSATLGGASSLGLTVAFTSVGAFRVEVDAGATPAGSVFNIVIEDVDTPAAGTITTVRLILLEVDDPFMCDIFLVGVETLNVAGISIGGVNQGTLEIAAATAPPSGAGPFEITPTGFNGGVAFTVLDGGGTFGPTAFADGDYTAEQTGIVAGHTLTDISCTGATSSSLTFSPSGGGTFVGGDTSVTVGLVMPDTVLCTFTNQLTPAPSLTVEKTVVGADGSSDFTATGASTETPMLMDGESELLDSVDTNGEVTTITETVTSGYTLTNIVCTGAATSTLLFSPSGGATFVAGDTAVTVTALNDEDVTCAFTNTKEATLTIVKSVAAGPDTTSFATTRTGGPTLIYDFMLRENTSLGLGPIILAGGVQLR